jgi:hypothetical protein
MAIQIHCDLNRMMPHLFFDVSHTFNLLQHLSNDESVSDDQLQLLRFGYPIWRLLIDDCLKSDGGTLFGGHSSPKGASHHKIRDSAVARYESKLNVASASPGSVSRRRFVRTGSCPSNFFSG